MSAGKKQVYITLLVCGVILAGLFGVAYYDKFLANEDKEKVETKKGSTSADVDLDQSEIVLPEQNANAKLPEVDLALLDAKTYNAIETFYGTLEDKKIEATDFEVLANTMVPHLLEGLKQHMFDGEVEFETSKHLFYYANLMLTFIYESGWYSQETLENSQWMTLMTLMTLIEHHIEGVENYDYRYEIEANHLGAALNMLVASEVQEGLGYEINTYLENEVRELFSTDEKFKKEFQKVLNTLAELNTAE